MRVALGRIAIARSGDKGDASNVGLVAPSAEIYEVLRREVTAERVGHHFADVCRGEVVRYEIPGIHALNFILHDSLGGGGHREPDYGRPGKDPRPGPADDGDRGT